MNHRHHARASKLDFVGRARALLGTNLVALWHSQFGITLISSEVDSWKDQIGNRVLQAPLSTRRPAYGADGVLFAAKPVVQCAVTANKCLIAGGLTGFVASGARPWTFSRSRSRTNTTGGIGCTLGTVGDSYLGARQSATNHTMYSPAHGTTVVGPVRDTLVHTRSAGYDGTNLSFTVDTTTFTTAYAGAVLADLTRAAVGCEGWSTTGLDSNSDESVALYAVCTAKPPAASIAAFIAMIEAEFP